MKTETRKVAPKTTVEAIGKIETKAGTRLASKAAATATTSMKAATKAALRAASGPATSNLSLFDYEKEVICGVDEAGRGPLAGPVFAAAVILDPSKPIEGLRDSKKLTAARREQLAAQIKASALCWSIAQCSELEIDSLNILQASMLAMRRAIEGLAMIPTLALIDGNRCPVCPIRSEAIIGGDDLVPAISAASILAKTARDAALELLHLQYPDYAFDRHKGYPTALHLERLEQFGVSPVHRKSYAPVRVLIELRAAAALQAFAEATGKKTR